MKTIADHSLITGFFFHLIPPPQEGTTILTVIGIFIFPNNHTNYSTLLLLQFGTIPTRLLSFLTRKVSGCLEPALLDEHGVKKSSESIYLGWSAAD
jgi:hypothetical protein